MTSMEKITLFGCITTVILAVVISIAYYNINDRKLMAQNISEAVTKGMDPLSVRCSYSTSLDTMCIAYSASPKK